MADFTALKTAIQTYIKQNGNEEITGAILQEILLSVVTTLGDSAINDLVTALGNEVTARQNADATLQNNIDGEATTRGNADTALQTAINDEARIRANADGTLQGAINGITAMIENGYVYAGIATPSTTPATGKVFYLALTAGTYTNFGSTEVYQGINILKYNGSAWSLDAFIGIDDTPTPNSPKLVKSGGAFESVMANGSAFDISAHFASGGTLATYADLSAALNALDTLSASYKRGGMSIKFVQSSDNKYVQYRYMGTDATTAATFTNVANWQGVDDEPTAGSDNLVKSSGANTLGNAKTRGLLTISSDLFSGIVDKEDVVFSGSIEHASINSIGIINSSTDIGATVYYVRVNKGDKIGISCVAAVNSVRYGIIANIPQLGDSVASFVNHPSQEAVSDVYICEIDGYFCYYTLRTSSSYTIKKLLSNFSEYLLKKVKEVDIKTFNKIPFDSFVGGIGNDGRAQTDITNRKYTSFIDVSSMQSIIYTNIVSSGYAVYGAAFYDSEKKYISSSFVPGLANQSYSGYQIKKISVPSNAVYARFTYWKDEKLGLFYVGDGEADSVAKVLLEASNIENSIADNNELLFGFIPKIKLQEANILSDNNFGVSEYIPVQVGDSVEWNYPGAEIRSCSMQTYDTNKNYLGYWNNNVADKRTVTIDTQGASYIRVSFLLNNANDSFVKVNNVEVWRGTNLVKLQKKLETKIDEKISNSEAEIEKEYTAGLVQDVPDFNGLNEYEISDKCINNKVWNNTGNCYMLPVSKGDVFYIKRKTFYDVYYAFLEDDEMSGEPSFVGMDNHQRYSSNSEWKMLLIPDNCSYLYLNKDFGSSYDHTPDVKTYWNNDDDLDGDKLLVRTFNSSYNPEDTETKRLKYCGLIRGKDTIETFLYFTDPHLTPRNRAQTTTEKVRDKYISMMQKYYNSLPIDFCICGGDWINSCDTYDSACDSLGYADGYMRKLFRNYYPVMGNHDNNPYDWGGTGTVHDLTQKEVNNLMFRENGNDYYAFDGINTRFYVLNTGYSWSYGMNSYRWEQIDWFANKLLADDPAHAIILTHIFSNGLPRGAEGSYSNWLDGTHDEARYLTIIASAFNNRQSVTLNAHTYDFSSKTGRVECYITGHLHGDIVDTFHAIPVIVTTDLQGGAYSDRINYTGHSYTLLPTFDCCLADYDNHRLHMVRVGAGCNRTVNLNIITLGVGDTVTLTSIIGEIETWHAEHPIGSYDGVLSVDSSGVVTALSTGRAGVRAINANGDEEYWTFNVTA